MTAAAIFTRDERCEEPAINNEIHLVSDGDGLLIFGDPALVERFLRSDGSWSSWKDIGQQLGSVLGVGSAAVQASAEVAANSSRWLKLTEESARLYKKCGLRTSAKTGLSTTVLWGKKSGQIGGFLEITKRPGSLLNPATLSGVAGVMAQMALQQTMAEINAKLATIDEKVTAVLRNQKIAEVAQLNGARLSIRQAVTMRNEVGRVTATGWSTVQHEPARIATIQAHALGQLQQIADKLDGEATIRGLAKAAQQAEPEVSVWLWVLTHSCLLQDAIQELALDREKQTSPADVDAVRRGMRSTRQDRLNLIKQTTQSLLDSLAQAARSADAKVLWHPTISPAVVDSRNRVARIIGDFHELLGLESRCPPWQSRQWTDAAAETRDTAMNIAAPVAATAAKVALPFAAAYLGRKSK